MSMYVLCHHKKKYTNLRPVSPNKTSLLKPTFKITSSKVTIFVSRVPLYDGSSNINSLAVKKYI